MKRFTLVSSTLLSIVAVSVLISLPASPAIADDGNIEQAPSKKVTDQVHATLAFTACVAKLINGGLAAQEARQLCIDSLSN
jgi:hypothetical protein